MILNLTFEEFSDVRGKYNPVDVILEETMLYFYSNFYLTDSYGDTRDNPDPIYSNLYYDLESTEKAKLLQEAIDL